MALTLKNSWKAGAAGLAALSMVPGAAQADNAGASEAPRYQVVANENISEAQELQILREATRGSRAFAKEGFNIGFVLHVGDDVTPEEVPMVAEYFRDRYQTALDGAYPAQNGEVRVFLAPNPGGRSTLASVNIGDRLFNVDNAKYGLSEESDPALLDLDTADKAVNDVVKVLPGAKAIQRTRPQAAVYDTQPG